MEDYYRLSTQTENTDGYQHQISYEGDQGHRHSVLYQGFTLSNATEI